MTETLTTEFWIIVLFSIHFIWVVVLFFLVKKMNRVHALASQAMAHTESDSGSRGSSQDPSTEILSLLEPLVEDSKKTALRFEDQIKEKRRLIKELNEALDSRIISINLLLSRADAQQRKLEDHHSRLIELRPHMEPLPQAMAVQNTDDHQHQILSLYSQNEDVDTIARKLALPKGEVRLVIDLKEKFTAMERAGK